MRISSAIPASGATARAVITSNFPRARSHLARRATVASSRSDSHALWRNSARRRRGSTKVTGPSTRQAMTIPGRSGARSDIDPGRPGRGSNRTSCAESRMWRSHRSSSVDAGNEVLALDSPLSGAPHRPPVSRMFHVKHRGRRPAAAARSRRGAPARRHEQRRQRGRRHPRNARRLVERFRAGRGSAARPFRWKGPESLA